MADTGWTPARVDTLKSLWSEGLSASQVAKSLGGVTRNAVIGKIHRLGLSGRAAGGVIRRTALPRPLRPERPRLVAPPLRLPRVPTASVVATPEGPGLAGSLVQLAAHACKWPLGDPKAEDFSFCGRRTEFGPYCAGHQQTAHQPRRLRPLADDPLVRRVLAGLAA